MSDAPRSADDALRREMGLATDEMLAGLDDRREAARFKRVQVAMLTGSYSGADLATSEGRERGQSFIFFGSLLNQVKVHTGRDAVGICPTACVYISGKDLRVHLAFNPLFLRALERVSVIRGTLPLSQEEETKLKRQGYWVWELGSTPPYRTMASVMEEHGVAPKGRQEWLAVHLDMRHQVAVLVHEFMHLLHKHLEVDWNLYTDKSSLNLAMDMVINQHIANLPPGAITPMTYAPWGLTPPLNQPFKVYYDLLTQFFGDQPRGSAPDPNQKRGKQSTQGFAGGALISMPGGISKPIERIVVGDSVLTFDNSGAIVARKVWRINRKPMASQETRVRYATKMVSVVTKAGKRIARVSSRIMVYSPSLQSWAGIGSKTSQGPELTAGETLIAGGLSGQVEEVVDLITIAPGFNDEALYQLAVIEDDSVSGYFAGGIYVKGLVAEKPPPPGSPSPSGPPPPPSEPGPGDDNTISSPQQASGPEIFHVGDEVTLRDGRTGRIVSASHPNDEGVQDLDIDIEDSP